VNAAILAAVTPLRHELGERHNSPAPDHLGELARLALGVVQK
jgi:hypothetical protein